MGVRHAFAVLLALLTGTAAFAAAAWCLVVGASVGGSPPGKAAPKPPARKPGAKQPIYKSPTCIAFSADGVNWDLLNDGMTNPKNAKSLVGSDRTPPSMAL